MLTRYIAKIAIASILLFLILGVFFADLLDKTMPIYLVNFATTFIYFLILIIISQGENFSEQKLITIVLPFNLFFVSVYNDLFFIDHGDYFAFIAVDSLSYDYTARYIAQFNFNESLNSFPRPIGFDDKGFVIYISIIYRIINSPLAVNFFNVLLNLATTLFLYRIGLFFLSRKGAFIAAIIFGISTYSVFYQASGLKETLMVFLVVASFYFFYKFFDKRYLKYILPAIFFCLLLFFFRVPLVFFVFGSIAITYILKRERGFSDILLSLFVIILIIVLYKTYNTYLLRYVYSFKAVLSIKEELVGADPNFEIITALVSGLWGPFPTIVPVSGKENISVLAGSLILKIFLSSYFIIGSYLAYKNRNYYVLPIAVFCLSEIFALSYLLESFVFRKGFPHVPFLILIAVYSYEYLHKRTGDYLFIKRSIAFFDIGLIGAIFFWNYLRFMQT